MIAADQTDSFLDDGRIACSAPAGNLEHVTTGL
jgi:hypothetical protein